MSAELIIYGAAYGPKDVTAKVRSLRKDQKLFFRVSNDTFGRDPWFPIKKTLVVVYKYTVTNDKVCTSVFEEGHWCVINPPSQQPLSPKNPLDFTDLKAIQQVSSRQMKKSGQPLVILGAAYGIVDVTLKAKSLLLSNGEFNQCASNDIWEDGWKGVTKTLVVVYEYDGLQMLDVVKQNERMHFIASPPMVILGAVYGLVDVTTKVTKLVKNHSLTVTANNSTFSDTWKGNNKTLAVTYQYGEETPIFSIVKEHETMKIIYNKKDIFLGSTNPNVLTILGAAYGPSDVTQKLQSLIKDNTLQTKVNNNVFVYDPWFGKTKSLVVMYRYGRNLPMMKVAREGNQMSINKVMQSYVGLVDTNNLLNGGDTVALNTINGYYFSLDSDNKLVTHDAIPNDKCAMTIKKCHGNFFIIKCRNGQYVTVNTDAGLVLYATSSEEGATMFSISISVDGGLRLATAEGMYVTFDSSSRSLTANSVDHFGADTIFGIAINHITDRLPQNEELLSKLDLAWASFIWKLTGGFFLVIGLGLFISTEKVKTGMLWLIKSSAIAWKAISDLVKSIANGLGNTAALVAQMLDVIGVLYHEGLLWIIFKEMLKSTGWIPITWPLAKITQVFCLPTATKAAELLATSTIWGVQTVEAGLIVSQAHDYSST